MLRGALVTMIYRKTLSVDASLVSGSQATTLKSADIEQIAVGFQYLHEIWANTIEAVLGLWLLQQQIGLSFLAAAVIVIGEQSDSKAWMQLTLISLCSPGLVHCRCRCISTESLAGSDGAKTS